MLAAPTDPMRYVAGAAVALVTVTRIIMRTLDACCEADSTECRELAQCLGILA